MLKDTLYNQLVTDVNTKLIDFQKTDAHKFMFTFLYNENEKIFLMVNAPVCHSLPEFDFQYKLEVATIDSIIITHP